MTPLPWQAAILAEPIPPVTLIWGPVGVGKTTLSTMITTQLGISPWDVSTLTPSMAGLRSALTWARLQPYKGSRKALLIDLTDSSERSQNALLKLLEEPPRHCVIIIRTSSEPLETVKSRCQLFRIGYLQPRDLHQLILADGMTEEEATNLDHLGSMEFVRAQRRMDQARAQVLSAIRAIRTNDRDLAVNVAASWTPDATWMLDIWASEAASKRPSFFSKEELVDGSHDKIGVFRRALHDLAAPSNHDRLTAKAVLPKLAR
jgi:DNA polymerase III delta prime subunit